MPRRAVARHISAALPVLLLLWFGWQQRWIGDDGFINLRVVRQLLAGNGFVFNMGERVEAVTSPLWVLLLTLLASSGVQLEDATVLLGMLLAGGGFALCCYASMRSYEAQDPSEPIYLPFGALAYAATPAAWDYVTSGLENSLGLCWLGASAYLTVSMAQLPRPALALGDARLDRRSLLTALVVGLGPVVRPDYALLGLPLGLLLLTYVTGLRSRLFVAGAGALPGLLFQIFRMGYFASLVPNTAFAKEAFVSWWQQGLHYLWNTVGLYWLLLPFGCLLLGLSSTRRGSLQPAARVRWALLLGGLLHVLYVVRVGGDFMHARMLLPGLAAICSSAALLPIRLQTSAQTWLRGASFLVLAGWAVFCIARLRVSPDNEFGIGDERGWFARMAQVDNPIHVEDYAKFDFYSGSLELKKQIAQQCPDGLADLEDGATASCARVAMLGPYSDRLSDGLRVLPLAESAAPAKVLAVIVHGPLGIPAAVLGLRVNLVDLHGLAEPIAAHMLLEGRGRPGHEKWFSAPWFAARYAREGATNDAREPDARAALPCGKVAVLTRAIREPMSATRFFTNLRLAFTLHHLRIPADPARARRELCDG